MRKDALFEQVVLKKATTLDVSCFCKLAKLSGTKKYEVPQDVIQMMDVALRQSASISTDSTIKRNSIFYASANKAASSLGRSGAEVCQSFQILQLAPPSVIFSFFNLRS